MTEIKMCPDCHWPAEHTKHDEIHSRLKRYPHVVDGVTVLLCIKPWEEWSEAWQAQLTTMVRGDKAALASKGWVLTVYHVDNYSAERESIRHWVEMVPA